MYEQDDMVNWRLRGTCATYRPYQDGLKMGYDVLSKNSESAKAFCINCPILQQCKDYALEMLRQSRIEHDPLLKPWGIWGGTNEKDRRDILRTEAKAELLLARLRGLSQDTSDPIAG